MDRLNIIQSYCSKHKTFCGINLNNLLDMFDPDGKTVSLGECDWICNCENQCDCDSNWMDLWFKNIPRDPDATKLICEIDRGVFCWKKLYDEIHYRYPSVKYVYVKQNYGFVDFTGCNFDVVIIRDCQSWDTPSGKIIYGYSITMGYDYMKQSAGEIFTYQQSNGTTVIYGFENCCGNYDMKHGLKDLVYSKSSDLDNDISEWKNSE
jgi:hypothetical protein